MLNTEVPQFIVPPELILPAMLYVLLPALKMPPPAMVRSPEIVQLVPGETPAVFEIVILLNVAADPVVAMAPVPPSTTLPVLLNAVPRNFNVWEEAGVKLKVPELLTVPLFVNEPRKVCVYAPPAQVAPAATLKATPIVHGISGVTPPVLLMFTVANVVFDVELNTGATVPLKLMMPDDVDVIAF